jgi:hypothetical protein
MWILVRAPLQVLPAALVLLALSSAGPASRAMAGSQFSVGVIEYNAKESQGGWTTQYGDVLAKQIKLIVDKINDKSNPSPVQFIALDQAKAESRPCTANDDTLVSCALEHNQLPGWTTIVSDCEPEQIELAYSKDWKLVDAPNTTNPLVDGYHNDDPTKFRSVCWAEKTHGARGRPYNIAYFENVASKETVLFVIVHMPHQYPDNCTGPKCYAGNYYWDIPQFKRDVQTVVGANVDLTKVHLIVAGDMNDLGNDNDPAKFTSILGDFGAVKISEQTISPPSITCCANDDFTAGYYDRFVTNSTVAPQYSVIDPNIYPLNKTKILQHNRVNKEHKATYGEVIFPATP